MRSQNLSARKHNQFCLYGLNWLYCLAGRYYAPFYNILKRMFLEFLKHTVSVVLQPWGSISHYGFFGWGSIQIWTTWECNQGGVLLILVICNASIQSSHNQTKRNQSTLIRRCHYFKQPFYNIMILKNVNLIFPWVH